METHQTRREQLVARVCTQWQRPEADVRLVEAPYRVCPLGAHIDHQLGTVTALALDRCVTLAFAPLDIPEVRLRSVHFPGEACFHLAAIPDAQPGDWGNYPRGAARALRSVAPLRRGLAGVVHGELAEMGVSSSAAFGVACLLALAQINDIALDAETLIRLDQYVENHYMGLRNGILDPAAIVLARRNHLTVVDCRGFGLGRGTKPSGLPGVEWVPAPPASPPVGVLIAFSGLRRALMGTDYNRRVSECTEAARILLEAAGRPDAPPRLSELSEEEYERYRSRLSGAPARRAAHYFGEMRRVREGVAAWRAGDWSRFGEQIRASGESSLRNYECGSPPLAALQALLNATPGVWGARFNGAGFRGSCAAYGPPEILRACIPELEKAYAEKYPELASSAAFLVCDTADGAL